MKLSTLLLAGSLAANAVLIGMIALGSSSDSASTTGAPREKLAAAKTTASADPTAPNAETWEELQAADLPAQRDRLRAAGFPPELVRAILAAQVSESFAARRKAIEQSQGETPFWKNPLRDPAMQAALRDLNREHQKILKDLLGNDGRNDDPQYTAYLQRQFGNLPADKMDQVRQIQDDYNQKRSDIYGSGGTIVDEDRRKLMDLDKAMLADLAAVMSPAEFEEYKFRSSNTAQQLRANLRAFDATEQEYRAIFQLQEAFDEQYSTRYMSGPMSQEEMRARSDAQRKLTEDIKAALGPDRALEYERAIDSRYRQATQLVARLELPPENAVGLWNVQKEFEQRMRTTLTGAGPMTAADRNQMLATMQQEAVAKVTSLLGGDPSRVDIYKQNGGQWLQNLAPRPVAAPRPAIPPPQ